MGKQRFSHTKTIFFARENLVLDGFECPWYPHLIHKRLDPNHPPRSVKPPFTCFTLQPLKKTSLPSLPSCFDWGTQTAWNTPKNPDHAQKLTGWRMVSTHERTVSVALTWYIPSEG